MVIAENARIDYRQWRPLTTRAVFLLVHGLGAHAGRWEAGAEFFAKKGIASYAVELRSFICPGMADDRMDNFRSYYSKILRLREIAAKENPGKKIFLAGESMGALISFLLSAKYPGLFIGLICISPAFVNRYKPSFIDSIKLLVPLFYNPAKQFKLPFDSSMCTRDAYYRQKLDTDPREYRSTSSKLIFEILLSQFHARAVKNKITIPALFLIAGEDKLVDPQAAKTVFNGMTVKDKTLVEFPGMYHSLSIDLDREKVYEEMLEWAEKRMGAI